MSARLHQTTSDSGTVTDIPHFAPALGVRGGHRQTLAGTILLGSPQFPATVLRQVSVSDGDTVVLHDDQPEGWQAGDPVVLLLHGLSGGHDSGYMQRIAMKLNGRGVRSMRMDHRGCGAGAGLAEQPYHAGRIDDLHRAICAIVELCPQSPVSVAGFSLSGNLLLRYLGETEFRHPPTLQRAVAVCPPIDLGHCVRQLESTSAGRRYGSYFTRQLIRQIAAGPQWREDLPLARVRRPPVSLYAFDDMFTAPASGFRSADDYYDFASARRHIGQIQLPTTILAAEDDPLVSPEPFRDLQLPPSVTLHMTRFGGHLGYVGRNSSDPDRRWMDWRVIEWLLH